MPNLNQRMVKPDFSLASWAILEMQQYRVALALFKMAFDKLLDLPMSGVVHSYSFVP